MIKPPQNAIKYLKFHLGIRIWLILPEGKTIKTVSQCIALHIMKSMVIALRCNACNLCLLAKIDLKPLAVITLCWYPSAIYPFIVQPGVGSCPQWIGRELGRGRYGGIWYYAVFHPQRSLTFWWHLRYWKTYEMQYSKHLHVRTKSGKIGSWIVWGRILTT